MFPAIGLLAATALLGADSPKELTLQQVLQANKAAMQAIRSIHVTIHVANEDHLPDEKEPSEPLPTYTYEWFKDGNRERVRMIWLRGAGTRGKIAPLNSDEYNGPDGWRRLSHYDPNFKPPLSESISGPAVGEIEKTDPNNYVSSIVRSMCHLQPFREPTEELFLKDPSCKLAATPATSKLGCYEITRLLEKRAEKGGPLEEADVRDDDVREMRIFVDPKAGFWIRHIQVGPWQKSTNPRHKLTTIGGIQEFKDCGNGIFFPMRAYDEIRLPDGRGDVTEINRYTLHSINQPLPEEDFHIPFPDWCRVYDRVSGKVFVWGPDDKPRREFASKAEYEEWYRPRARDAFQPQLPSLRGYWTLLVGISVAVALLLLTLIIWRRRAARVVGRSSPEAGNT